MFGGEGDPIRDYNIGGFQISLTAVEALRKQLASELGRHGVRVVSLLTGGVIDSIPADFDGRDALVESLVAPTLLGPRRDAGGRRERRCLRRFGPGSHDHRIGDQHHLRRDHHLSAGTSDSGVSSRFGRHR